MGKLWAKGYDLNNAVERFTVSNDPLLDYRLIPSDILGSLAHATMLESVKLLTAFQSESIKAGLKQIQIEYEKGQFAVKLEDEDGHTAIENRLVEIIGEPGKRVHLGRSRNDQALTAMRIWMRHALFHLVETGCKAAAALLSFAEMNKDTPMPGRTHTRPAMPSTVGLWAGGFAEQLLDDIQGIASLYPYFDQCPLGSAAGYGVPLPLNRELTASLLGFSRVQNNVTYGGLCRGKFESRLIDTADQTGITLSKLATDLISFSQPEFGWFTLPQELCTGSSIMPQKRNPDALELMRSRAASVGAWSVQVKNIIRALPSGYNRDYQDTKEPTFKAVATVSDMLAITELTMRSLEVNHDRLAKAFDKDIFAADAAISLVAGGMNFRDAYREVGIHPEKYTGKDLKTAIAQRKSSGNPGNPRLDIVQNTIEAISNETESYRRGVEQALMQLAGRHISVFTPLHD